MGLFGSGGSGSGSDAEIKITADTGQAEQKLNQLDTSVDKVGQSASSSLPSMKNLGIGIAAVGTAAVGAIAGLSKMAVSLAAQGENLGSLKAGFDALGGSMGTIDEASERVLGLASRTQLLETANRAMVAGLPDVNKNFGDIADLGARLANTLGQDVNTSIEGLTNAIARGVPRQLQQYGIMVDSKTAAQEYAAANGLLADKLTETQRRAALQEAALRQVKERLGDIAEVTPSVTNVITAMGNKFTDMKAEIGEVINSSSSLIESLTRFKDSLALVDTDLWALMLTDVLDLGLSIGSTLVEGVVMFGNSMIEATYIASQFFQDSISWAGKLLTAWQELNNGIREYIGLAEIQRQATSALGAVFAPVKKAGEDFFSSMKFGFESTRDAIIEKTRALLGLAKTAAESSDSFKGFGKALDDLSNDNFPSLTGAAEKFRAKMDEFKKGLEESKNASNDAGRSISRGLEPEISKLGDTSKKAKEKIAELVDVNKMFKDTLERNEISGFVATLNKLWSEGTINVDEYKESLIRLQQEFSSLGFSIENINAGMSGVNLTMDTSGITADGEGGFFSRMFDNLFGGEASFGDALSQSLGNMLTDVFSTLNNVFADALGIELGGLGASLGQGLGAGLAEALLPGTGQIGGMIGGMLGGLADKIFGGSTNEQTRRRRDLESYIDDIFQTWDFIARDRAGNMVRFEDLVLGDRHDFNPGSAFMEELEGFDDDLRVFFRAIGGSLGVEFVDDFTAGAQLGEKLMTAWGGDLDSLQLLLYETGMTFEEFEENLVRAFKRGQISAEEFVVSMQKGEEMFQPGLVGLGQWERAIDNFIESGGRGTASMKSLKDMFIEFRELNPNGTFEEFREEMIASGKLTADEADILFDSLRENGITTFEELMEASDSTIIRIIANMKEAGFAFSEPLEQVQERLDGVERSLDRLGSGSIIPITLRIRSEYDSDKTEKTFTELDRSQGIGLR